MQKYILRFVYSGIIRLFLKVIVGVKIQSAKFLLDEEQFIIVANHNSHLDTMTLLASLPSKMIHKVKPVAAADHFGKTRLKEKLTNYFVNTILIQRKRDKNNPESDPIFKMNKALKDGYSLILFPEGTRGDPEIQQPLKPGIAIVLKDNPQLKYVPAYMKGMGKAMPKDDNLILPYESSLVFGKPTLINSDKVSDILAQISADFEQLKQSSAM